MRKTNKAEKFDFDRMTMNQVFIYSEVWYTGKFNPRVSSYVFNKLKQVKNTTSKLTDFEFEHRNELHTTYT